LFGFEKQRERGNGKEAEKDFLKLRRVSTECARYGAAGIGVRKIENRKKETEK
jgi:hypothetical protein